MKKKILDHFKINDPVLYTVSLKIGLIKVIKKTNVEKLSKNGLRIKLMRQGSSGEAWNYINLQRR